MFCILDSSSVATLWLLLCRLLAFSRGAPWGRHLKWFPTFLKKIPEMPSTWWLFCLYSSVHLLPNHRLAWGQVTAEAGSPDAALHRLPCRCCGSHAQSWTHQTKAQTPAGPSAFLAQTNLSCLLLFLSSGTVVSLSLADWFLPEYGFQQLSNRAVVRLRTNTTQLMVPALFRRRESNSTNEPWPVRPGEAQWEKVKGLQRHWTIENIKQATSLAYKWE